MLVKEAETHKIMLEACWNLFVNKRQRNTEGAIKNGQTRETRNMGHTRRRQTEQNKNKTQYRHGMCFRMSYVFVSSILNYFDFHNARVIFDVSSGFYFWNVDRTPT